MKKCFPASIALFLLLFGCGGNMDEIIMPCSFCAFSCGGNEYDPEKKYCSNDTIKDYGFVTHKNKTYKFVEISARVWMAENLDVAVDSIRLLGSYNYKRYGNLYDWATAMQLPLKCDSLGTSDDADCKINTPHQGICPTGWHIPTFFEWYDLRNFVDSSSAGKNLKAAKGWDLYGGKSGNGYDKYGFAAMPGGYGSLSFKHPVVNILPDNVSILGYENFVGKKGLWWMVQEFNSKEALSASMSYGSDDITVTNFDKSFLFNIRCVRDSIKTDSR